jgi:hypothetical protein
MKSVRISILSVSAGIGLLAFTLANLAGEPFLVKAQEPKRFQYKIVDVLSDTQNMQATLNQYGSDGWELVAVGMGDLTAPRLIFKK